MNRSHLVTAFCLVGVLTMTSANTLAMNAADENNIRTVARAYAEAWNHHDMKALAGLFTHAAERSTSPVYIGAEKQAFSKPLSCFTPPPFQKSNTPLRPPASPPPTPLLRLRPT